MLLQLLKPPSVQSPLKAQLLTLGRNASALELAVVMRKKKKKKLGQVGGLSAQVVMGEDCLLHVIIAKWPTLEAFLSICSFDNRGCNVQNRNGF